RLDAPAGCAFLVVDEAAAGEVVVGDGELEFRAVFELDHFLHRAFAVGALAEDGGALVVHQRAGDDLGGAGGVLIHEHDHREKRKRAGGFGHFYVFGTIAAFGGDDDAFFDEQINDLDGLIELAAGVPAQIKDQAGHSFFEQIAERVADGGEGGG